MLDALTGAYSEIQIGPKTYKVNSLKLREIGQLQRFIRENAERPTAKLKVWLQSLDADRRNYELDELKKQEITYLVPDVFSEEGNSIIFGCLEGQKLFVGLMLRRFQEVSDSEVDEVLGYMDRETLFVLSMLARAEDGADPKAVTAVVRAMFGEDGTTPDMTGTDSSTL